MTPKDRLEHLLCGGTVDRPPFMPAIYDLKPHLVQKTPHTFGQDVQEVVDALAFEAEKLKTDALTSAYDIYNIEAEAVGCTVLSDPGIPMPEVAAPLINRVSDVDCLQSDERPWGRMGLFIQAAKSVMQRYGQTIPVRGGISGPFSMAAKIFPEEDLLMESVMNPEGLVPLLRFCTDVINIYARGFAKIGAGVIVFDSFTAPPMLSPQSYHDLVLPFHKEIFARLEHMGVRQRTLIIGGNTVPIMSDIVSSGATQFLIDFTVPLEETEAVLQEFPDKIFRVNLPPGPYAFKDTMQLETDIDRLLKSLRNYNNIIIGTGILPPEVPAGNIQVARKCILSFYN